MHLNLKLSVDEANVILGVLSQHPYSKVFQLIQSIQAQAAEQLLQLERQAGGDAVADTPASSVEEQDLPEGKGASGKAAA